MDLLKEGREKNSLLRERTRLFLSLGTFKPFGLCSVVMVLIMFVDSWTVVRHHPANRLHLNRRGRVFAVVFFRRYMLLYQWWKKHSSILMLKHPYNNYCIRIPMYVQK